MKRECFALCFTEYKFCINVIGAKRSNNFVVSVYIFAAQIIMIIICIYIKEIYYE